MGTLAINSRCPEPDLFSWKVCATRFFSEHFAQQFLFTKINLCPDINWLALSELGWTYWISQPFNTIQWLYHTHTHIYTVLTWCKKYDLGSHSQCYNGGQCAALLFCVNLFCTRQGPPPSRELSPPPAGRETRPVLINVPHGGIIFMNTWALDEVFIGVGAWDTCWCEHVVLAAGCVIQVVLKLPGGASILTFLGLNAYL